MTTTLDKLDTINDSLNDIKTAVIAKGQTPSGDITTYATAISNIVQSSPVIDSLSITPTTSAQTITAPSGTDGYSPITVSAVTASIDNNIVASNIVSGVSILGVNGSATVLNGETVNITPSTSAQTITPTSPKNGITQANVAAVTASIDANITAGNIKKDVTILGVTGSLESGGGGGYQLRRIKDDNNNEIGTAFMEFEDANGNKYDVVCLDAQYRLASGAWCSNTSVAVTNLPLYDNLVTSNVWESKETATSNTQKILDFCSANGYTSESATHCRNKIFNINNIQYYGQIPNLIELNGIARNYNIINSMDTSASSNPNTNFNYGRMMWSSNQNDARYTWLQRNSCYVSNETKTLPYFTAPVLEIPK